MGETISHYRIECRLGAGGMGEVFRAEDLSLKRPVALKLLSQHLASDEEAKQRLIAEARAAAALNHPNIATVYEVGEASGQPFIAMEYVEGETLELVFRRGASGLQRAIEIAIQIAEALKAAHANGLIHCDVKSSNVALTRSGQVKLLDCGIARLAPRPVNNISYSAVSLNVDGRSLLNTGNDQTVSGTLAYLSPEQIRGEPLDSRTDIFSFGVVLYEMLAGRRPFDGDSRAATARSILSDEPARIGRYRDDIPLEVESILRRMLEKSRDDRYPGADELLIDLNKLMETVRAASQAGSVPSEIKITETGKTNRAQKALARIWPFRKWLIAALILNAIAALLILSATGMSAAGLAFAAAAVFCAVAYLAARAGRAGPVYLSPSGAAFRGLLPFQEADRDRFFGRESDTLALFEKITHGEFRFGVLFGESGAGKTSLVKAGLVPGLWEAGLVPIYCRSYKDPLAAVVEECRKHSRARRLESETTVEYLERVVAALDGPLVLIFDQFEEFFVNFKLKREREPFVSFVADCLDSNRLAVKFLFSMRSDFLYLINSEFAERIAEPLATAKIYHLRNFDEKQAAEIIEKSARKAGLSLESGLSKVVARDLAVGDAVLPSELQIVGERLQSRRIFTVAGYNRAGGKEPLVHSFLEEVIQASVDREACGLVLRSLISEENTRLTLTLAEIEKRTQRGPDAIERLVNLFVSARLIRVIQDDELWRYELMHEYLIDKINQITGRVMDATQRANRLFRQYLSSYAVDRRTRIPITRLWTIRRYSDIGRGERERELLKKSLRWGVAKASAVALALATVTVAAAAWLSISEEWEGARLSDGHRAAVRQAVFSPDGRLLASGGEDMKLIVWDFARRSRLATFSDHTAWITTVAFSPDGRFIATGGYDNKVIIYDAMKLEKIAVLSEHVSPILSVAFSPDGRLLATAAHEAVNDPMIIWDVGPWSKRTKIAGVAAHYGPVIFTPDGNLVLLNREVWNPRTGERLKDVFDGDSGWNWAALTRDGSRIVSIDGAGNVRFSDLTDRELVTIERAHRDNGRAAAVSPDGKLAATGAEDVILWDVATRTKLARLEHTAIVWSAAFSPDGRWLVSSHGDGSLMIWDVKERERVAGFNEHSGPVRAVAYSPDGRRLASGSEDGSVIIWDRERSAKESVLLGHSARVLALAFSPDGSALASCDFEANLFVWDVDRMQVKWKHSEEGIANGVTFSPDGRFVVSGAGVFESEDGRPVSNDWMKTSPMHSVYGIAFSPDGRWLACVSPVGKIILLDAATWQIADVLQVEFSGFVVVAFLQDGKRLVTGDEQGAVKLWDLFPLRPAGRLGNHGARIKTIAVSPDGDQVASGSDDQTIALWSISRRSLITYIGTHTAPVLSVAFSPDGKRLASGEHDRSVRIYSRRKTLWGYSLD